MKTLYHPNALPAHLRERLPNPSRPIDEPVVPASAPFFDDKFDPIYQSLTDNLTQKTAVCTTQFSKMTTAESILIFLKNLQNQRAKHDVMLADFIKNVRPLGQTLIETVVSHHPDFYPNSAENRLLMTAQFWQNLLALFLLAQCHTRKTLNHELSLTTLSQQMNGYLAKNARQVEFLTHDKNLQISPENVAFAIVALDGNISKKGKLGERVTNISSHNFLTQF